MATPIVYIVLPTYNERENLGPLVEALLGLGVAGLRVLVVDDASPDGTGEVAEALAVQYPGRVEVLHRPGKQGLGTAYCQGFALALAQGADRVVQMDADFSHPPDLLPAMLLALEQYDIVVASRYVRDGRLDPRWPWRRRFVSRVANMYARWVMGLPLADVTGGFKAFRRRALEAIDLGNLRSAGFAFQVEVNSLCRHLGFRVGEVPFTFRERRWGRSKLSLGIMLEVLWTVWQLRWRHRQLRPLLPAAPSGVQQAEAATARRLLPH